jgi:hypothetical protein
MGANSLRLINDPFRDVFSDGLNIMSTQENEWFETWFVEGVEYIPAYLVVVTPNPKSSDKIIVLDLNTNKVLFESSNYEGVRNWLIEDGFSLVTGRVFK